MPFGITSTGFVPETLSQVQADLVAALQAQFGADIDTSAQGPFGQLVGIWSDRESTIWQLAQALYNAAYPDTATGSQLDDVCSITGTVRLPATKSTDWGVGVGANLTVVPQATVFGTPSGTQFSSTAAGTIATLAAWVATTAYSAFGPTSSAAGALVTNGGNIYACVASGTSAGSGGPTGTGTAIADGTCTWRYVAAGSAAVAVPCSATVTGPLVAPAGTMTTIVTPVAGLTSVTNPLDAVPGTNIEADAALRLRRAQNLVAGGKSPVASIQAALLKVTGVTQALVFENPGDVADGSGRPPHSIECVVAGATDAAVALAIWQNKAAGCATTGTSTQNVTDPVTGVVYAVKFTRPTAVPIYVAVTLTSGPSYGGGAAVKQAIVDYALATAGKLATEVLGDVAFQPGQTVYASPLAAAILDEVSGILDIASVFIGIAPTPTLSTPLAMAYNQVASFQVANVTVNGV